MRRVVALAIGFTALAPACQYALDVRGRCDVDIDCLPDERCEAERCVPGAATADAGGIDAGRLDAGPTDGGTLVDAGRRDSGIDAGGVADSGPPRPTCEALGLECGPLMANAFLIGNCGPCVPPAVCRNGVCAPCLPMPCPAELCGSIPNGCGGVVSCGGCPVGEVCGGGGPNLCGSGGCSGGGCAQGPKCGLVPDGCSGTTTCMACLDPSVVCDPGTGTCVCRPLTRAEHCSAIPVPCTPWMNGCDNNIEIEPCSCPNGLVCDLNGKVCVVK